jgi:N-acetylglucosaminyl-diphospho-decaprenol L-rhamnosyltransferase
VAGRFHRPPDPGEVPIRTALISAVVVNYKTADLTVACVASLAADGAGPIVVVDSASGDSCGEKLRASGLPAVYLPLAVNEGYGRAANAGVDVTDTEFVLVCNPDLVVQRGTVNALAEAFAEDATVGAVGPRIDRPDGVRYPSARRFPSLGESVGHGFLGLLTTSNRWSRSYLRTDDEAAGAVDWVSGACFAARRVAWDAVGGFDPAFFMFMEDVDLCWRLRRAGWGVRYEPGGRVVHLEGASRAAAPYRMILAHHRSLLRYAWRTSGPGTRALLPVVAAGLAVRTGLLCARTALSDR